MEFLKERKVTIPHKEGLMFPESGSRLPHGQMSDLLGAYCQHILEKGYPMSAVKTRLSAVIWLHKINGVRHECLKPMWDKAGNYISTHKPKEKQWLTDKQLSDLDNRAWEKIERDPLEAAFRVVYECVREAIYRPISVTLKTLTDTDIRLRMEDVKFGQADDKVQCLDMSIREKIKGNPMANVRLKKWPYNPTPNCKRGGLFNAMDIYLNLNPKNKTGPIAYPDGTPVTYTRFKTKLRWWGVDADIPFKVTPAVLRRSTIKSFAHCVPETQLRFLARHLSEETAKKYYLHLTKNEVADIRASLAIQYTGGTQSKDSNLKHQPTMFPHALFPRTLSLRFVLIV